MKAVFSVLFLCVFLVSSCEAQFNMDWMKGLFDNINTLNSNIRDNVGRLTQRIQDNVHSQLDRLDKLKKELNETLGSNLTTLGNIGNSIIVNGAAGTTRIVYSGHTTDGEPYLREIEERVVGNILYHHEKIYNSKTKSMDVFSYTLDLNDPNAKPISITPKK